MNKQHRLRTRLISSSLFLLSIQASLFAQKGVLQDQGGAVFNVKAYGATANGTADDTSAIQAAIDAATKAHGGTVFFPAGSYVLNGTLHDDRADMVSLAGSGMASRLMIKSKVGISLGSTEPLIGESGFHSGRIQDLFIRCNDRATGIAIQMTDMIAAPSLDGLTISNCDQGFDIINQNRWTERLVANDITDDYNNHLFHYDQRKPKLDSNSYGYGTYHGIFVNKGAGQDVFYLTGGGYLYHTTFVVKGNLVADAKNGAAIFHIHGAPGEPCSAAAFNYMDISVEGNFYSIVKVTQTGTGCSGGSAGNPLVSGIGYISAAGSTAGDNNFISDPQSASYLAATFTATNAPSETVKVTNASPASKCYVQPANAVAANAIVGTYVSGTNWGSVSVIHPPAADKGQFQIWCTP